MPNIRPFISLIRHGINQVAALAVYHYSGPYIAFFARRMFDWFYGKEGALYNWGFFIPEREEFTNSAFHYGKQYGPMVFATLAAWGVHCLQGFLLSFINNLRTGKNKDNETLQYVLDSIESLRGDPDQDDSHVDDQTKELHQRLDKAIRILDNTAKFNGIELQHRQRQQVLQAQAALQKRDSRRFSEPNVPGQQQGLSSRERSVGASATNSK